MNRCPRFTARNVQARHHTSGASFTYANAVNLCRLCGHSYEVTTFLGNDRRSFICPCCRKSGVGTK